jgi:uncharacterized protein YdiU (UPF0061 family)
MCSLLTFGNSAANTLIKTLRSESPLLNHDFIRSREVKHAHFTFVAAETPKTCPKIISASQNCARLVGIAPEDINSTTFCDAFCGNTLLPGLDRPYSTVYGCHSFGSWFGQLGYCIQ